MKRGPEYDEMKRDVCTFALQNATSSVFTEKSAPMTEEAFTYVAVCSVYDVVVGNQYNLTPAQIRDCEAEVKRVAGYSFSLHMDAADDAAPLTPSGIELELATLQAHGAANR